MVLRKTYEVKISNLQEAGAHLWAIVGVVQCLVEFRIEMCKEMLVFSQLWGEGAPLIMSSLTVAESVAAMLVVAGLCLLRVVGVRVHPPAAPRGP